MDSIFLNNIIILKNIDSLEGKASDKRMNVASNWCLVD